MADYIVEKDGWIAGRLRRAGDRLSLSAAAAKYENLRPAEAEGAAVQPAPQLAPQPAPQPEPAPARKAAAKGAA